MTSWRRVWDQLRYVGRAVFVVLMLTCFVGFVAIGFADFLDRDRKVYWGTFRETSTTCDSGPRRLCTITGRWVSDDRSIIRDRVLLDGRVGPGGAVRASYRPGGFMGDDESNVVHTSSLAGVHRWLPWVGAAITGWTTWSQLRWWRGQTYRRRHSQRKWTRRGIRSRPWVDTLG